MNSVSKSFLLLFLLVFSSCDKAPKNLEELIERRYSGETTINEEIWIEEDEILILEEGSTMIFGSKGSFQIKGEFEALGTAENPISLIGNDDLIAHTLFYVYDQDAVNFIMHHTAIKNGLIVTEAENNEFFEVHILNDKLLDQTDACIRSWRGSFSFKNGSITSNNRGEGLLVHGTQKPEVSDCSFYKIPDAVEFLSSDDGVISNSIFQGMSDDAIDNNNCRRTLIQNNQFYDVGDRALEIGSDGFGASSDIKVDNNLFVNCKIGINVKESSSIEVTRATFFNNRANLEILNDPNVNFISSMQVSNTVMSGYQARILKEPNTEFLYTNLMSDLAIDGWDDIYLSDLAFENSDSLDFTIVSTSFPLGEDASSMGYQK